MKISVFTDVHGNLKALKTVLAQIVERNVDMTVFLGDIFQRGNAVVERHPCLILPTALRNRTISDRIMH